MDQSIDYNSDVDELNLVKDSMINTLSDDDSLSESTEVNQELVKLASKSVVVKSKNKKSASDDTLVEKTKPEKGRKKPSKNSETSKKSSKKIVNEESDDDDDDDESEIIISVASKNTPAKKSTKTSRASSISSAISVNGDQDEIDLSDDDVMAQKHISPHNEIFPVMLEGLEANDICRKMEGIKNSVGLLKKQLLKNSSAAPLISSAFELCDLSDPETQKVIKKYINALEKAVKNLKISAGIPLTKAAPKPRTKAVTGRKGKMETHIFSS